MRYGLALLLGATALVPVAVQARVPVAAVQDTDEARAAKVSEALGQLRAGDAAGALATLEPVLAEYDRAHPAGANYRCVDENSSPPPKGVTTLGNGWCYALWAKGYALVELQRLPEAAAPLERATLMMPDRAQFHSELGYVRQALKQWEPSLASYTRAADIGVALPNQVDRERELRRAWFGMAFALIELGRLDEAEKLLQKCLELTPDDEKVKSELEYIREQRAKKS